MINQSDQSVDLKNKKVNLSTFFTRPYMVAINKFRVKVNIHLDKKDFIIKTATSDEDLEKVLKLRHDVFFMELLGKKKLFGIDIDKYDMMCDHLLVIEKSTNSLLGTYRLNSDLYSDQFYSEKEYYLGKMPGLPGLKLEIGRACIHKDYRKSNMMGLLWEGVYTYLGETNARYIFGCSSISTTNPLDAAMIHTYLKDHNLSSNELGVSPRKKYSFKNFNSYLKVVEKMDKEEVYEKGKTMIPKLINDYFLFGAKVYGAPALDKSFQCIDVLTMLDMASLNHGYKEERFVE